MIRYALLGLLREQSDYGYSLKHRFETRVGACWELNVGQVYQTLQALRRAGFVSEVKHEHTTADDSEKHTARRMFALTPKGVRFLERWLRRTPDSPRPIRDEIIVRLLVQTPDQLSALLTHVAKKERLQRDRLIRLLGQRHRALKESDEGFVCRLNFEAVVRHTQAHVGWLEYCREALEARLGEAELAASVLAVRVRREAAETTQRRKAEEPHVVSSSCA